MPLSLENPLQVSQSSFVSSGLEALTFLAYQPCWNQKQQSKQAQSPPLLCVMTTPNSQTPDWKRVYVSLPCHLGGRTNVVAKSSMS
jgi:hypothetical protein